MPTDKTVALVAGELAVNPATLGNCPAYAPD
jgi:hypothetical protein